MAEGDSGIRRWVDRFSELFIVGEKFKGLFGGDAKEELKQAMEGIDKDAIPYWNIIQTNTRLIQDLRNRTYRTNSNAIKKLGAQAKIKLGLKNDDITEIARLQAEIDDARKMLDTITADNQDGTRAETEGKRADAAEKTAETTRKNNRDTRDGEKQDEDLKDQREKRTREGETHDRAGEIHEEEMKRKEADRVQKEKEAVIELEKKRREEEHEKNLKAMELEQKKREDELAEKKAQLDGTKADMDNIDAEERKKKYDRAVIINDELKTQNDDKIVLDEEILDLKSEVDTIEIQLLKLDGEITAINSLTVTEATKRKKRKPINEKIRNIKDKQDKKKKALKKKEDELISLNASIKKNEDDLLKLGVSVGGASKGTKPKLDATQIDAIYKEVEVIKGLIAIKEREINTRMAVRGSKQGGEIAYTSDPASQAAVKNLQDEIQKLNEQISEKLKKIID